MARHKYEINERDITAFVTQKFNKLCTKFGITIDECDLKICDYQEFLEFRYDMIGEYVNTPKELMNDLINNISPYVGSTMFCNYVKIHNKLYNTILFPKEKIYEIIAHALTNPDIKREEVFIYLEQCLKHELGHVLVNRKVFEKSLAKRVWIKHKKTRQLADAEYADKVMELTKEWVKTHKEEPFNVEFYKKCAGLYYSKPNEKAANDATGVNVSKLIDIEIRLHLS